MSLDHQFFVGDLVKAGRCACGPAVLVMPCLLAACAPGRPTIAGATADPPYQVISAAGVRAVVTDNRAVDDAVLPEHRQGYSGLAALTHQQRAQNLFVAKYAGLNFEHIHDGRNLARESLFEPRHAPLHLVRKDERTVELHQPPTPFWKLESWLQFQILDDGVIELRFTCLPHAPVFANGYIGLFFASYIEQPESPAINFRGQTTDEREAPVRWIEAISPEHGTDATHPGVHDDVQLSHDPDFALTLVNNLSRYRFAEPWYYGVSHGMALVQMFRASDGVRLSQSPSGGGPGNPAWDFQWIIPDYQVGQRYTFVMRTAYLPFQSAEQIAADTAAHRAQLQATGEAR